MRGLHQWESVGMQETKRKFKVDWQSIGDQRIQRALTVAQVKAWLEEQREMLGGPVYYSVVFGDVQADRLEIGDAMVITDKCRLLMKCGVLQPSPFSYVLAKGRKMDERSAVKRLFYSLAGAVLRGLFRQESADSVYVTDVETGKVRLVGRLAPPFALIARQAALVFDGGSAEEFGVEDHAVLHSAGRVRMGPFVAIVGESGERGFSTKFGGNLTDFSECEPAV